MNYRGYYEAKHDEKNKNNDYQVDPNAVVVAENKRLKFWLGASIVSTIVAVIGCCYCHDQMTECKELVSGAVGRLKDVSNIDVDKHLVDRAVNTAAREAANKAVEQASKGVFAESKQEIRNRVKQAVEAATSKLNDAVAAKMAAEVEEIDKDEIIKTVVASTTETLTEKLEEDIGDEMTKVGEIYKNIVEALT